MMNIFQRLTFKIGVMVIIAELIVLAIVGIIYINNFTTQIEDNLIERVNLPGNLFRNGLLALSTVSERDTMQDLVGEELKTAYIVGTNQNIFYALNPDDLGLLISDIPNIDTTLFNPQNTENQIFVREGTVISISPIFANDGQTIRFFVYIEATTLTTQQQRINTITLFVLGTFVTVFITSLVIILFFDRLLLSRVRRLGGILKRAEEGDLSARVVGDLSKDEVGDLENGANVMISRLQDLFNSLEKRIEERTKELEIARKEAENASAIKSQFLANMSHELRTPLNAILNFTAFVADGVMGDVNAEQEEALRQSISSGKHLLSLINDILDVTKIEAGLMDLFIQEVDLGEIISGTVSIGKGLSKDKPVQLNVEMPENLPITYGDKRRLRQVFLNIISNAFKFTPQGSVTIHAHATDTHLHVRVTDTGIGISPEHQKLVFESFKQAQNDNLETVGTGLGMPISKYFVESHNGRIWFETEVGKGTTFFVELPLLTEAQAKSLDIITV